MLTNLLTDFIIFKLRNILLGKQSIKDKYLNIKQLKETALVTTKCSYRNLETCIKKKYEEWF